MSSLAIRLINVFFLIDHKVKVNHVNHVEVSELVFSKTFFEFCPLSATSSAQWYQWNTSQPHTRLCAECWTYYKKLGGVKYPKKSGKKIFIMIDNYISSLILGVDRRQGLFDSYRKINCRYSFFLERAANITKLISYKCTVTGCGKV